MNLTDNAVKKLALATDDPDGKIFFDNSIENFGVRVYRSGRKKWVYQYRMTKGGRTYKFEIGDVAKFNREQAKTEAKIAAGHVAKGENPIDLRRQAQAKHKDHFGELVAEYLDEKLHPIKQNKKPMRPRSYAEVKRHLEDHCRPLSSRAIRTITQDDIASLYKKISRSAGPGAASHVWSTGRAFMHWCMGRGILEKNVFALYDGAAEKDDKPKRTLRDSELAIVWKACRDDQFGKIVKLLLLTGGRRDEVGHAATSEIDLAKAEWMLPAARSKNGCEHMVPLSDLAVELLAAAVEAREDFVFGHGTTRGFSGWSKAKAALDRRIAEAGHKLTPWTIHDLRRSFANGLQRIGTEPHIVEACLNHLPPKLERTYQTYLYADEKRIALDRWAKHLDRIVTEQPAEAAA
ncbi:tyrosine-type recombinase/integrase [Bradyrhizobium sp. LLZ17]|uniref:Tyrosine-type recombinase/integrase n=1 Tax=Bradyrhizobium sp. LLZ17 TaxID=3239388 RepID=A0AB39XKP3_9BRAD